MLARLFSALFLAATPTLAAAQTERINLGSPGDVQTTSPVCVTSLDCRYGKDISRDGRFVVFETLESLVPMDTNNTRDAYVRDRETQRTMRVSFLVSGAQGGLPSNGASMSPDGRFVTYARLDSVSLVQEVFVHDRDSDVNGVFDEAGATSTAVVVRNSTGQPANGSLFHPVISDGGRYLAFETEADNLDPLILDDNFIKDVYWLDRDSDGDGIFDEAGTALIRLVSRNTTIDVVGSPGPSTHPAISADGRHVAFKSLSPLDSSATGVSNAQQVYVHDVAADVTRLASMALGGAYGDNHSNFPALSATGRYLVFESRASNLVPMFTTAQQVYLRDRDTDVDGVFDEPAATASEVVSLDVNCQVTQLGIFTDPSVSDDGRFVAYSALSSAEIVTGIPDPLPFSDVFVHDRATCQTVLASQSTSGVMPGDSNSRACEISGDGMHVAYASTATDLIVGDTNSLSDIFVTSLGPPAPFSNYCVSTPTSTGNASTIQALGSASVLANDLVLSADSVAAGEPGLFYYGPTQLLAPFGNGTRCVGGPAGTVVRIFPFGQASGAGVLTTALDNTLPVHVQVAAGASLNFQGWFRDPAAGGAGFDLSDGLNVLFGP